MTATSEEQPTTAALTEARADFVRFDRAAPLWESGSFALRAACGERSFWVTCDDGSAGGVALRSAHSAGGPLTLHHAETKKRPGRASFELTSDLGAHRVCLETARLGEATMLHCTTYFRPLRDLRLEASVHDLYVYGKGGEPARTAGTVHCAQRGLRTGIVYASSTADPPVSLFYLQNFTALAAYFDHTTTTPANTVGGAWPELGYAAPVRGTPLRASVEYVVSDVYLLLSHNVPQTETEAAQQYLDLLSEVYLRLPKPAGEYHHWPAKARETVLHLSHSPKTTYERLGKRYVTPYVGDESKPPESMVQLVVLVALLEYQDWTGERIALAERILENLGSFFNETLGTVVRWLPGDSFVKRQDPGQDHDSMDSWYLYHVLFNLTRLTVRGEAGARRLLKASLPYAMRVARRFAYRWPVFFRLSTLEIIRAEASEGRGGENDVAGLYALTMLHAYDIFGDECYLDEAKAAIDALHGLGFSLAYQMNTTLFAAEAALRLFKITGVESYRGISEICLASAFNNVFLWECEYGYAQSYHTFFGLFPLQDAPYFAAYEELEALAKFREYFRLGRGIIRPSLRLLMAEYCKNFLPRAHYYFPSSLPSFAIATEFTNGKVERSLEIPLEDMRDGRALSGQVGQETYGAGLALICATRHYINVPSAGFVLFCDYPAFEFRALKKAGKKGVSAYHFRVEGDARATCSVRIIPSTSEAVPEVMVKGEDGKRIEGSLTAEGHREFRIAGDQVLELSVLS